MAENIKTPKQNFIDDRIGSGCDRDDILFLAELNFTESGDIIPGSMYDAYLGKQ